MKHSPQRIGLKPYGENETIDEPYLTSAVEGLSLKQAAQTGRFWVFAFIQFCFVFCTQLIVVHIAPHAMDIGILAIVAASIVSIINGNNVVGKLALGFVSDRVGHKLTLTTCLTVIVLVLIWLLFAEQVWMFYVFAVVFGIAWGGVVPMFTLVPAELFGLKHLGSIAAASLFLGAIGAAIGTPLAGYIYDMNGNYGLAFLCCVVLGLLAMILSLILLRSRGIEDMVVVR